MWPLLNRLWLQRWWAAMTPWTCSATLQSLTRTWVLAWFVCLAEPLGGIYNTCGNCNRLLFWSFVLSLTMLSQLVTDWSSLYCIMMSLGESSSLTFRSVSYSPLQPCMYVLFVCHYSLFTDYIFTVCLSLGQLDRHPTHLQDSVVISCGCCTHIRLKGWMAMPAGCAPHCWTRVTGTLSCTATTSSRWTPPLPHRWPSASTQVGFILHGEF